MDGIGFPYLPFDESVDHAAILIETPHLEGLVQRVIDTHAIPNSHLCVYVYTVWSLQQPIISLSNYSIPLQ